MSPGQIGTDTELSGPRPRAWVCRIYGHDEIRIDGSETAQPSCLTCGLPMAPIDLINVARRTINKYGADSRKPSVLLACGLIDGAHERDRLHQQLKEARAQTKQARDADEDNRCLIERLREVCAIARGIDSTTVHERIAEIEREAGLV